MATRRIPDPKIGGSIPSEVSSFLSFLFEAFVETDAKNVSTPGFEPGSCG